MNGSESNGQPRKQFPPIRKRIKRRRIITQKMVKKYMLKLKPVRYDIRLPLKDKRGPFLAPSKGDIVGKCIQIRESVFIKMRKNERIYLIERILNKEYAYEIWKWKPRRKPRFKIKTNKPRFKIKLRRRR